MITANAEVREKVITWSSAITDDPSDVSAVVDGAGTLLDWLEATEDEQDYQLRVHLMERFYANCFFGSRSPEMTAEQFAARTDLLYLFVTGAQVMSLFAAEALAPPEAA